MTEKKEPDTRWVENPSNKPGADMLMPECVDLECMAYQFGHASLILKSKDGRVVSLHVQEHDQYAYQREFSIEWRQRHLKDENGRYKQETAWAWRASAYKHPFRPSVELAIPEVTAEMLIERFLELAVNYPTLLFNNEKDEEQRRRNFEERNNMFRYSPRPVDEGFVHFHERLLWGYPFNVYTLDQESSEMTKQQGQRLAADVVPDGGEPW